VPPTSLPLPPPESVPLPEASSLSPPSSPPSHLSTEQSPTLPPGDPVAQIHLIVPPSPPPALAPSAAQDRHELRFQYRALSSRVENTTRALARAEAANDAALSAQAVAAVAAGIAPLVAPPADVAPPVLLVDRAQLIATFSAGLYSISPHLRDPFRIISKHLLDQAVSQNAVIAADGVAAFQLLPGLVEYSSRSKGHVLSPAQLLAGITSSGNISHEILNIASSWQSSIRARPPLDHTRPLNPELTRARIESLCKVGRFSSATRVCRKLDGHLKGHPPAVQPSLDALAVLIEQLHPPANDRDLLPDDSLDPPLETSIQINPFQLRDRIYRLSRDSSSGQTGWSSSAIKDLADDRREIGYDAQTTPPTLLHHSLTNLCNKMLRGEVTGIARDLLVAARLNMVPKDTNKYRPIRIECAICRLYGAVASDIARKIVGPGLQPLQTGGGLRCGVEFGARMADLAYRQEDTIISVDLANAFNTVRHGPIFSAIMERYQPIARFFRWKYGTPSEMRDHSGNIVAHTCTGVGQGDPWGGLFFELGYQAALLELSTHVSAVAAAHNRENPSDLLPRPGRVVAYEDDTQVMGPTILMFRIAPSIAPILARHGFHMNIQKSYITGINTDCLPDQPEDFNITPEGLMVLGVPTGGYNFRRAKAKQILENMAPPTAVLSLLSPRTALHLIIQCYNPQPAYLLRTTSDFSAVAPFAQLFDKSITNAIAAVLQVTPSDDFETRCSLPRNLGGIGLSRHNGMATEKNQILSRLAFFDFLALHFPPEYQVINNHFSRSEIRLGQQESLEDNTGLTEEIMLSLVTPTARGILTTAKTLAYKKQSEILVARLADFPESQQHAAIMLSSTNNSTSFIHSSIGLGSEGYFSADEFRCIARARLGFGPTNDPLGTFRVCACHKSFDAAEDSLHALSCGLNKGPRNTRHDAIRDMLYQLIKKLHPGIQQTHLTMECVVGQILTEGENPRNVRTDIKFVKGADTLCIDIAVVDPAAATYMQTPTSSHLYRDGAASKYEREKRQHYSRVSVPSPLPPRSVIPFILEATGRLGPSALLFLHTLCGTQTFLRSRFLSDVNLICARTAGRMLKITRDRFQGLHQGVLLSPMHG
jgi:Reverse transcriptase (RNA-dependent DNA polymerase)